MLKHLLHSQRAALWYVLLVVCLPVATLTILGLIHLWQNQWLLLVSMIWLGITAAGFALYRFWPTQASAEHRSQTQSIADDAEDSSLPTSLPTRLEPRPEWTALDKRVWSQSLVEVEQILNSDPHWKELPEQGIQLLSTVSRFYDLDNRGKAGKGLQKASVSDTAAYSFTLPEMLMVLSVTSSRYRQLLLTHLPFAERIRVSSLLTLYSHQDQIIKGAGWLNTIRRTARLANPIAAITAELRDQFTNRIFTNLSEQVQRDLKRLLLQELTQVAMDLYSGRLKHSADELAEFLSQSQLHDSQRVASPAEPLRVVIVGQVSSGKSSLVNALVDKLHAETGILPTTDSTTVHLLTWQSHSTPVDDEKPHDPVHLVDTIGITDTNASIEAAANLAQQADLLIWVTRATQPARAPEAALHAAVSTFFERNPRRRSPPMLLVMTHIDQLKPKAEWDPPYDLGSNRPKAQTISRALHSCIQQIGLPHETPAVPVCLAENRPVYNTDVVAAQIMVQQADATQAQLNRRRTEKNRQSASWHERWEQASNLGKVTGKLLIGSLR